MNKPSEIKEIVWDADNTLWDWVSYAVPAYEAMSNHISQKFGIAEPFVAEAMQRFYTEMGTMEHVFLVQGLYTMNFFEKHGINLNTTQIQQLATEVQRIFAKVRSEHLKLYDGVENAFHTTMQKGIRNTILTDAPGIQAPMRLKHFGLYSEDSKKMRMFALRATSQSQLPEQFREKQLQGHYDVPFQIQYIEQEKPDTNLEDILEMTKEEISRHVVIIGDNQKKDMGLAKKYQCRGLHAKYGEAKQDLLARLLRFAPVHIARKNVDVEQTLTPANDNNDWIIELATAHNILPKLNIAE